MPFSTNELNAFFEQAGQMALARRVRNRLAQEGLAEIDDFSDFKEEQLMQAFRNMRTSISGAPEQPRNGRNCGVSAIEATNSNLVYAKCTLRLKVASFAYHYYDSIGREHTPANMHYTRVLKDFYTDYKALLDLKDEDKPDVHILQKHSIPLKWTESFKDCLYRTFGICKCPLSCLIHNEVIPKNEVDDPLLPDKSYRKSGSLIDELIQRIDHDSLLYRSDNVTLYTMLEEATRNSIYSTTIKPYSRKKDGRSTWNTMISLHASTDKWEKLQKECIRFLMNSIWNGRTYRLEKFMNFHRTLFIQLEEAATRTNSQLPNDHTRVSYLIDNIVNNDPDLRAAIASIRVYTDNIRSNFEAAVTFMLPVDPYIKHKEKLNKAPQIHDVTLKGKTHSQTGVDFRWHTSDEYKLLTKEKRGSYTIGKGPKKEKKLRQNIENHLEM